MRVWYHPLFNDTIDTMNVGYNIRLNKVVGCWMLGVGCLFILCYLGKTQPFQNNPKHLRSKWQVYRTNIRI